MLFGFVPDLCRLRASNNGARSSHNSDDEILQKHQHERELCALFSLSCFKGIVVDGGRQPRATWRILAVMRARSD